LSYEITGKGQQASIVVTGTPRGGTPQILRGSVQEWKTTHNGSPWEKQPETMLVYRGTRQWARMYAPEALLGVYAPDEMEEVREVDATVRPAEAQPARTAAVEPVETKSSANPAPVKPAAAELIRARALWSALETHEKGRGVAVLDRLCALHGAKAPKDITADKLASFGKDVDELMSDPNPERIGDLLDQWEHAAKEAQP
jgi:hypothetical protein